MTIKMIASDMDGTFLNERGLYDKKRFQELLRNLEAQNIKFVVASGNNMGRLRLIFNNGLADQLTFVAENGAHLLDQGTTLVRKTLAKSDLQKFLAYFDGHLADYRVIVSGFEDAYILKNSRFDMNQVGIDPEQMKAFFSKMRMLSSFSELPEDEDFAKITMMLPVEDCQDIMTTFNQTFTGNLTATTSGYGAVDIINTGIHKAWGLSQLMGRWNIKPDELMTFGDGGNDIEMLRLADYSYAMDNAPHDVKAAAKFIAPSHRQAGVMETIEHYLETGDFKSIG